MTPEEIAGRIAAIHAENPQGAWNRIPPLWRDVLTAIAAGAPDAHLLASAALRTGKPQAPRTRPLLTRGRLRALLAAYDGTDLATAAQDLGLRPATVRTYIRDALRTLDARDAAHAVEILLARGEISETDLRPLPPS
ncbi:hypothetical protein ACFVT1_36385 [Streptomyces sp. NPDC057963]|uniref:hypothetical protein n=1 Tax=Streptomyces sp. NPDC057963 TaxID=3346290 RepID=UPI0036EC2F6B